MIRRSLCYIILAFALALAACAPVPAGPVNVGTEPLKIEVTPVFSTAITGSVSEGTVEPFVVTQPPLDFTPLPTDKLATLTPIPALSGGLGPTELKYRILAQFPDLFFCDPDYYPVARMDEMELARERFPELQANPEEFEAILAQYNLTSQAGFSDEQKLLIYQEHKRLAALQLTLAEGGYQFQMQSAKTEGNGELISGSIDSQGAITVQQRQPVIATCPICLAEGTLIDTPDGPIPVEHLLPGMPVWTLDHFELRIATVVSRNSKTSVPPHHQVVHLVLEDGRQLWASPGHPTADGRAVGQVRQGDLLDGARVLSAERVAYDGYATYDLLPAGETGFYWANGILIASTLTHGQTRGNERQQAMIK